jgi:hypothetical protein
MALDYQQYWLDLRSSVSTALTGLIGTYTYQSSLTTTAIRVEPGATPSADNERPVVTGLEVVIQPFFTAAYSPLMDRSSLTEWETNITLKQWAITGTTLPALDALQQSLDNIKSIGPRVLRNSARDTIEQVTITITSTYAYIS